MVRRAALAVIAPVVVAVGVVVGAPTAGSAPPAQSPVDITPSVLRFDPTAPALGISYHHSAADVAYVQRDGDCAARGGEETEQATPVAGAGYVTYRGKRYDLAQFHFHTPSEHTFEGRHDPLEMHLVHKAADGETLVIGVPLRVGTPSAVDGVLARLTPECGAAQHIDDVDLAALLPTVHPTARYTGSLTTAPYTEGVLWFLMPEQHVTAASISRFQQLFPVGNARPTQPLNGRTVTVHQ